MTLKMNVLPSKKTKYNGPDLVSTVPQNLPAETATALKCCHGNQRTAEFHSYRHLLLSALRAQCPNKPVPSTSQSERSNRVPARELSGLSEAAHERLCRPKAAVVQWCTREHYPFLRRRRASHRGANRLCQNYRQEQHMWWGERRRYFGRHWTALYQTEHNCGTTR